MARVFFFCFVRAPRSFRVWGFCIERAGRLRAALTQALSGVSRALLMMATLAKVLEFRRSARAVLFVTKREEPPFLGKAALRIEKKMRGTRESGRGYFGGAP